MTQQALRWQLLQQDGAARTGVLQTRRATIETPVFMPVGTLGTVKGVRFEALESSELDAQIILGNTYHLWLRPGAETIRLAGGLHRFIGWDRALLTDSGGYQVWSLGALRRVTEEGVEFRSHVDGRRCFLSPEVSMEVQAALGSDIVMAFDECAPGNADAGETRRSMELTARWARRSHARFTALQREGMDAGRVSSNADEDKLGGRARSDGMAHVVSGTQALFGIVQGATHLDLRRESLASTVALNFDGYALGGLSVGEEKERMYEVVAEIAPLMPSDQPRYLMGVGTPQDLVEAVGRGIDMFDCVLPTRNARTGQVWTSAGKLNIRNARFTRDTRPLDEACQCSVCQRHTRAYLRHLHITGEMLASILLTHHNLAFFLDTMRRVRQSIRSGNFTQFRQVFIEQTAGIA